MRFALFILLAFVPVLSAAPALGPDHRGSLEALRQAAEVLEKMERDTEDRIKLWCDVAALRQKLGDPDGASVAIRRAWEITDKYTDENPERKWRTVIVGFARLGETKRALELAAPLPEIWEKYYYPRREALTEAATQAALAGHFKCAAACAEAIPTEGDRKETTNLVRRREIVARFKAGDTEGARRAVKELLDDRQKIITLVGAPAETIIFDCGDPADGIADAQWRAGDKIGAKESALQALDLLHDSGGDPVRTALQVVRILSGLDDIAGAKKILTDYLAVTPQAIMNNSALAMTHLFARGCIGVAEVRARRDDAALALLKDDDPKTYQTLFLSMIGLAQARAGRKEESKATFARVIKIFEDNMESQKWVVLVITAQAQSGDFDGAALTSKRFCCGSETSEKIILAQAAAGDFDGARNRAEGKGECAGKTIRYPSLLRHIAKSQAAAGQWVAVREWAAKPHEYLTRASILIGLAEGLCQKQAKPGGK